ncbi:hypothetical protein Taro_005931 [Colocasia esculenta]|uniref:Uncharacterized protein n=1 Tax=Colocasia esculenta TaxID=4460 RepID=A0A843TW29_COLES|nr:hypothetical protein [Colocasia esculenta]
MSQYRRVSAVESAGNPVEEATYKCGRFPETTHFNSVDRGHCSWESRLVACRGEGKGNRRPGIMAWAKGLAALQLVVLSVGALSGNSKAFLGGEEAAGVEVIGSPPPPPHKVKAPKPPPPPSPLRYHVAVEGVIYCKTCKLSGYNKYVDASPLPGAVARLECTNSGRRNVTLEATTDKNGYFFLQAPKVSSNTVNKCRVYLVSSPLAYCKKPSNLNGGVKGAKLKYEKIISDGTNDYALYTSGFLQFAPTTSDSCPN